MADMPKVNPRDMPAKLVNVVDTHRRLHAALHKKAAEQEAERAARDAHLNAEARLQGKTS